jgi:hypothetical protein
MYRVLLKSMIWCAPDDKDYDPRRSCREGQERETEREPGLGSNLSDWTTQHNRSGTLTGSFTAPAAAFRLLFLTIRSRYLSAEAACRNEAAAISAEIGSLVMTTFDKREEAFETKFVLDEAQKFKAEARRNRLLGLWVASKLGMSGDEANAYAREVVAAEFDGTGEAGVARKVMTDLAAAGIAISEEELRLKMDELMAQAVAQVKAGT